MEIEKSPNAKPTVLSVGNCAFDHGNISRVLEEQFGVEVKAAATSAEAVRAAREERFDLVLVNHVFDGNNESGLDLIKRLKAHEETKATPVMLISNYADAQEAAVALGAQPGFGKSALNSQQTRERLSDILKCDAEIAPSARPSGRGKSQGTQPGA